MKKKLSIVAIILLLIVGGIIAFLWYLSGGILGEMLFDRPGKPKTKHGEFPFELVYEYNNKEFRVNETIVCDYEGISFVLDGGNSRKWACSITNNDDYGRYYLDKEKYESLYIQVPLEGDYYMGDPNFDSELAIPYIHFIDDSTGTMYYEQDSVDVVGAKIIKWDVANPLEGNIE